MEHIFTKASLVESLIGGGMLYFFPKTTIGIVVSVVLLKLYFNSKLREANISAKTMKAAIYTYGIDYDFREIEVPKIGPDDVLVKVKGASLNPVDYKVKAIQFPFLRWFYPHTVGRDFSGEIVDRGENVRNFNIGDNVYGNAIGGSLQEYTRAKASQIGIKPNNISFAQAASIALAGGTSLQSLKWFGKLNESSVILIIGASGGCGSLGVQIAKTYGAKVYGVCSYRNIEFVKGLGCDVVVDYSKPNHLDELKDVKFDLIYDAVTSPEDTDQEPIFLPFLKETGHYVAINCKTGIGFVRSMIKCEKRSNFHLHMLNWNTNDLELMRSLVENSQLKPLGCEVCSLNKENINSSFEKLRSRRTTGKLAFEI